jgi:hypothetical protein
MHCGDVVLTHHWLYWRAEPRGGAMWQRREPSQNLTCGFAERSPPERGILQRDSYIDVSQKQKHHRH